MTARTKWVIAIVALLAANVIAMLILAFSARGTVMDPSYRAIERRANT